MSSVHPYLEDKDYWDLRIKLLELQSTPISLPVNPDDLDYLKEIRRNLIEDLHNYLNVEESDPWKLQD